MNNGADAADQIVNMSLRGIEIIARISGEGTKNLATYLYAVLKDQKKTKGKTRLEGLLRSGKELKVFAVRNEDLKRFTQEAKRYGVLYCALRDKKSLDGMCDIMVRVEDAAKINRIVERFKLATVDMANIKKDIERSKEVTHTGNTSLKESPAEKSAKDFLNDIMTKPGKPAQLVDHPDNQNPTMATTERSRPSEPTYGFNGKSDVVTIETERKSVRQELKDISATHSRQATESRQKADRGQPKNVNMNLNRKTVPKSKPKEK